MVRTDDHCSPFLLRTLEDVLYIVSTTSPNSTSRAIYTPTAPDDTQLFSKLECGHWYEIVLKPGEHKKGITIPGDLYQITSSEDSGRIVEYENFSDSNSYSITKPIVLSETNYTYVTGMVRRLW